MSISRYSTAIALMLASTSQIAFAEVVDNGTGRVLLPSAPYDTWTVRNGSSLRTFAPGVRTDWIDVETQSMLTLDGATVDTARSDYAVSVNSSTATISNTTITNTSGGGVSSGRRAFSLDPTSSRVTVTNSSISAIGRGVLVQGDSSLTLSGTTVVATGGEPIIPGGSTGLLLGDGTALIDQGSHVRGAGVGAWFIPDLRYSSDGVASGTLTVDGATVEGGAGAAVHIGGVNLSTKMTDVNITVQNGGQLIGGNGRILHVDFGNAANLIVDDSTLTGDVFVTDDSIARVALRNDANLSGNLINVGTVNLDHSVLTGDVTVSDGRASTISLANSSTLTGNLTNVGTLSLDASTLTGNALVAAGSPSLIALANGSTLTGDVTNVADLAVDRSTLTGNVTGIGNGSARMAFGNQSTFTGTLTNGGAVTIDGGSIWRMTGNSSAGSLAINNARVELSDGSGAAFRTLTLGSLTGNGTFLMSTNLVANQGDLLRVTGQASGDHVLHIRNTGAGAANGSERLKVVETGGGSASFTLDGGVVDLGAFQYELGQDGTDWYLGNLGASPSARTVVGVASATPSIWYGEVSSLRARMGDLRLGGGVGSGIWGRAYGGEYSLRSGTGQAFDQQQWGMTLGADMSIAAGTGQLLLGLFGGYGKSTLDFHLSGAKGRVKSYYVGVYATWLLKNGWYIDGLIKQNWFSNDAVAVMSDGVQTKGDFNSTGFGGQIEVGRRFAIGGNWILEPYAQLAAFRAGRKGWGLDNGMSARNNGMDSFVGRIGAHIGYYIASASGSVVQPYLKLAVANEFDNDNAVYVNTVRFNNNLSGARGEVGAGIAAQLSKRLQVHGEFDYGNGRRYEQKWGANFGLRYSF